MISERVKGYLEQLKTARRHLPTVVKYLAADSFYSKKSVVDGVVDLDLHLVSKLRIDADLRYCYTGEQKPKGAPRKYDGKVDLSDLSRLELSGKLADGINMYSQVVWHVSLKRQIRIVCLGLLHGRETRFVHTQAEFIFRDAKQFTGLCDCQSRQQKALDFHFNTSLNLSGLLLLRIN